MRRLTFLLTTLAMAATAVAADLPEIPFEKYVLDNGLEVILHEDHTIPTVAVNVWYHVGSKNEKPGRTGFAHLFEHMMFQGSQHHDDDYFAPLQRVGGQVNGSTNEDRTNYWENVPSERLELALWLEADRMGFLVPAMTDDRLANQKGVVQNEKREGENEPYAVSDEVMTKLLFSPDHPYGHTIIGSMDDLSAATKQDVSDFFALYYAPNNASLCVAGDFDPAEAKAFIAKYFGTIPPGRPVQRIERWSPVLDGERRAVAEDDVELPRVIMAWHTPALYAPDDAEFGLLAAILSNGKSSRLYQALVYEQQIAQDVSAWQDSREIGGVFQVEATAKPGVDLARLEKAVDAELRRLLDKGVARDELARAQTGYEVRFIRRLQSVGGFGGRADLLNGYNVHTGNPGFLAQDLGRYRAATPAGVTAAARRYLDLGRRAVLQIVPHGKPAASDLAVARDAMPGAGSEHAFAPPPIRTADLPGGLKLYLVEKHELPLVQVNLVVRCGWAADPSDRPGAAAMTADLLDEGTRSHDALAISDLARDLGAQLGCGSDFDGSYVNLGVLKRNLDAGLALMGDVVMHPAFPAPELERIRSEYLGRIRQESVQPEQTAYTVFQKMMFGEGHPYAQPFSGTGTKASVAAITREDLVRMYETYYRPNNAAVVVVGDITLDEAVASVTRALRGWESKPTPAVVVPPARQQSGARILLVDRPGAQQSVILLGQPGLARRDPDVLALNVLNTPLGGQFMSRINMNLREDKGYTYGARSTSMTFAGGGVFLASAPVQTQFTKESVAELLKELRDVRGDRPLADAELAGGKNQLIKSFPQRFQTIQGIAGQLGELVLYGLPLDDWATYRTRVEAVGAAEAARMAREHIDPDAMRLVIVGDRAVIEPGLRELGLGDIEVVDADAD
jgi:zinc protease